MKKKIAESIQLDISEVIERKFLVEFKRKQFKQKTIFGFILASNEEFVLIQGFDKQDYTLVAFIVLQWSDINIYRVYDDVIYYLAEVVTVMKIIPAEKPSISLESWESILRSANEIFPLVGIHQEHIERGLYWVGKVKQVGKKSYRFHEIDPSANWDRKKTYKYKNLTQVNFGGRYESTLWEVSESRKMK
jgi:hypothetical protein